MLSLKSWIFHIYDKKRVQLTLEQHGFELHGPTYIHGSFFNTWTIFHLRLRVHGCKGQTISIDYSTLYGDLSTCKFWWWGERGSSWNQYPVDTVRQLKLEMTDDKHDWPAPLTPVSRVNYTRQKLVNNKGGSIQSDSKV